VHLNKNLTSANHLEGILDARLRLVRTKWLTVRNRPESTQLPALATTIKQRRNSVEQFTKGYRSELAAKEAD
jgi:uncharacterized protein YqeY